MFSLKPFIDFLFHHQVLSYLILFLGSYFETVIGISFFVYGEIFFLAGSILAGMNILNIWLVILVFYLGGVLGDSTSYFLGRKYGYQLYQYLGKNFFLKRYLNKDNYQKGSNFFKKYGKYSVFFARFLGPISWITPFLAGIYNLNYKTFLIFDFPAVILGIGQFIIVGYFAGIHYKILLNLFFKYLFIILFLLIILLYFYLQFKKFKRKKYFLDLTKKWTKNKKKLIIATIKYFVFVVTTIIIIFFLFLFYLSFVYQGSTSYTNIKKNKSILLNNKYLNNCKNLNTYYFDSPSSIIQPINIVLITNKDIPTILKNDWIKDNIFKKENHSFKNFLIDLKNKTLPVSNLYANNISQDVAYQYKKKSLTKREHIRFWSFTNKNNPAQKIYLGSISNDDGFTFKFYNHFFSPIHEVNKNIDKSRDFFYQYLLKQKNIKVDCRYIQTKCQVKKTKGAEDQQYYTDGKILLCKINLKR
ncbi:MAG TPA: hypothetical protein ENL06_03450 [Candidatus Portnoybacteria bacterium]|nr:hypothetical protein [Candidatus Portnoybacteria bacterium]